jgi:hypothetical protein
MQAKAHVTQYVSLILIILSLVAAVFFNPQGRLKQVNEAQSESREISALFFQDLFSAEGLKSEKLNALVLILKSHDLRAEFDIFFEDSEPLGSQYSDIRIAHSRSRYLKQFLLERGIPSDAFEIFLTLENNIGASDMRATLKLEP